MASNLSICSKIYIFSGFLRLLLMKSDNEIYYIIITVRVDVYGELIIC